MSDVKKQFKGMDTKEMIKCEGCGEYHPLEECEIVIIKIIKGKNCVMPSQAKQVVYRDTPIVPSGQVVTPTPVTVVSNDQPVVPQKPRRNIIPPQVASMMLPPDHPQYDQFGAKETRRV